MTVIRLNHIDGVPILYDRAPAHNYGITGYQAHPYINEAFSISVVAAFQAIFQGIEAAGIGSVKAILFGGIGRVGQGRSYHHQNRAFDLDGLVIGGAQNWVASTFPDQPFIYLGIEATLRQHFGTVLSYDYNQAHQDHFHFDNGTPVGFQKYSKSRVLFLQNALTYVFDIPIGVDGVYGPQTLQAERSLRAELGLGGFSKRKNWLQFLEISADASFARHANLMAHHSLS